ncbi:hypothetical protein BX616_005575, partial [Lobosporangium transversale]
MTENHNSDKQKGAQPSHNANASVVAAVAGEHLLRPSIRKHSHTAAHSKIRPMMRTASGLLTHHHHHHHPHPHPHQHHHHHHHHHSSNSNSNSNNINPGNKTGVHKQRRRRAKFVFGGDLESKEEHVKEGEEKDHQNDQQERKDFADNGNNEGLLHDDKNIAVTATAAVTTTAPGGQHLYHPIHHDNHRHRHDPYPQQKLHHQHNHHEQQQQQQHSNASTSTFKDQIPKENKDTDHSLMSESIPNNSKDNHPSRHVEQGSIQRDKDEAAEAVIIQQTPSVKSDATTTTNITDRTVKSVSAKSQKTKTKAETETEAEVEVETDDNLLQSTRLTPPRVHDLRQNQTPQYDMINVSNPAETSSLSSSSSSIHSITTSNPAISLPEPLYPFGKKSIQNKSLNNTKNNNSHDSNDSDGHINSNSNSNSNDNGNADTATVAVTEISRSPSPLSPSSSSSSTSTSSSSSTDKQLQEQEQRNRQHLPPSKRLSRLLHPSPSTASLPSITRTISQPVLTVLSTDQASGVDDGKDGNHVGNQGRTSTELLATLGEQQQQQHASLVSPVAGLVSKFLGPYTTTSHKRSQSQSSLSSLVDPNQGSVPNIPKGNRAQKGNHKRHGSSSSIIPIYPDRPRRRIQQQQQLAPPRRPNSAGSGFMTASSTSSTTSSLLRPTNESPNCFISRFLPSISSPSLHSHCYHCGSPVSKNTNNTPLLLNSAGYFEQCSGYVSGFSIGGGSGPTSAFATATATAAAAGPTTAPTAAPMRRRLPASLRMTATTAAFRSDSDINSSSNININSNSSNDSNVQQDSTIQQLPTNASNVGSPVEGTISSDQQQQQQQQQQPIPPLRRNSNNSTNSNSSMSSRSGINNNNNNSNDYYYSSGNGYGHTHQTHTHTHSNNSPWKNMKSISRTQQKLDLQRASSQEEVDESEIAQRSKLIREMERIQREYRSLRLFSDPLWE